MRGGTGTERSLVGADGVGGVEGSGGGTVEVPETVPQGVGGGADVRTEESVKVRMGETDGLEVGLAVGGVAGSTEWSGAIA
jgi:hypothetical protein